MCWKYRWEHWRRRPPEGGALAPQRGDFLSRALRPADCPARPSLRGVAGYQRGQAGRGAEDRNNMGLHNPEQKVRTVGKVDDSDSLLLQGIDAIEQEGLMLF